MTWQQTPPDKPGMYVRERDGYRVLLVLGPMEMNEVPLLHHPGDWWVGPLPEKPAPPKLPRRFTWRDPEGKTQHGVEWPDGTRAAMGIDGLIVSTGLQGVLVEYIDPE